MITGWKTITGAAIIAASAILEAIGFSVYSNALFDVGVAVGLVGLGHKVEKSKVAEKIKLTRKELREALQIIRARKQGEEQ